MTVFGNELIASRRKLLPRNVRTGNILLIFIVCDRWKRSGANQRYCQFILDNYRERMTYLSLWRYVNHPFLAMAMNDYLTLSFVPIKKAFLSRTINVDLTRVLSASLNLLSFHPFLSYVYCCINASTYFLLKNTKSKHISSTDIDFMRSNDLNDNNRRIFFHEISLWNLVNIAYKKYKVIFTFKIDY